MKIRKIMLTKVNTLQVVYKDADNNVVTLDGVNIVHKDLKEAMNALIPHFALLCEMKEAGDKSLKILEGEKGQLEGGVYNILKVSCVELGDDEAQCQMIGSRILQRGDILNIKSPKVSLMDDDQYKYLDDLSLALDGLKYEAKLYIEEKKWGLKEATIDFAETGDPFKGEVKAGNVPVANVKVVVEGKSKVSKPKGKKKVAAA